MAYIATTNEVALALSLGSISLVSSSQKLMVLKLNDKSLNLMKLFLPKRRLQKGLM